MMYPRIRMLVILSIIAAAMVGCSEKPKTVEWYMEHKGEREVKLKWCRDDMGRAVAVDCLNAEKAAERVVISSKKSTIDTFKYQPPVTNGAKGNKVK